MAYKLTYPYWDGKTSMRMTAQVTGFGVYWVGPQYRIENVSIAHQDANYESVSASEQVRCEMDAAAQVRKMLPKGAVILDVCRYVMVSPTRDE